MLWMYLCGMLRCRRRRVSVQWYCVNFVLVYERVLLRHVTMRRQQRYIKRRGHSRTTINRTAMPIKSIYASTWYSIMLYKRERQVTSQSILVLCAVNFSFIYSRQRCGLTTLRGTLTALMYCVRCGVWIKLNSWKCGNDSSLHKVHIEKYKKTSHREYIGIYLLLLFLVLLSVLLKRTKSIIEFAKFYWKKNVY